MKFKWRVRILSGRTVVWKLSRWRAVKRLFVLFQSARRRMMKCIGQNSNPPMQLIINATEQTPALQLICLSLIHI